MKIVNEELKRTLASGTPINLELGSGESRRDGFYSLDKLELPDVDIVCELSEPLVALPSNSVSRVYSRHVLEHVEGFMQLMEEMHRVVVPGGEIEIVVPHFSNVYGYSDPTHVRVFGLYSMYYFVSSEKQPEFRRVPGFYGTAKFIVKKVRIEFYRRGRLDRILAPFLERWVNRSLKMQDFYERRLSNLYHAWQVRYLMTPDK